MNTAIVQDVPLTPHPIWPLLLAVIAGGCYGFIAHRNSNSVTLWAISAGGLSFVVAMLASGLANAVSLPYTDEVRNHLQFKAMLVSVVLIAAPLIFLLRAYFQRKKPQNP